MSYWEPGRDEKEISLVSQSLGCCSCNSIGCRKPLVDSCAFHQTPVLLLVGRISRDILPTRNTHGASKAGPFFPLYPHNFCLLSSFFMSICFCWPSTSGFALSLPLEGPPYWYRSHNKYHETDCTISLDLCIRHVDFFVQIMASSYAKPLSCRQSLLSRNYRLKRS